MLGNLSNLANLMKSAKDVQGRFAQLQETLASHRHEGDAGGGMVCATVDGKGALVRVKIDPAAMGDVELLEDLIKAAVGAATAKSQEAMKRELAGLTGGLNIPGLSEMLGGA
ncbi:MAG: YbaB/EbfC family nucleoid-associated protein [Phycisphaerae bacterium]